MTDTIDAGLARVFFSWTLHAIVYFWLIPAYIAYYRSFRARSAAGCSAIRWRGSPLSLFLVVAMPIGIHHVFEDPQVGAGFKFLHSVFTALVALPTLLTVFTICASVEIAARLRGGSGGSAGCAVLPWHNPVLLGAAFSFVMLGFGGAGGLINMSYQLNTHDPQHAVGHRAFPPDLRRRDRDHVFRDRLRHLAAFDRARARQFRPDADPAVDLVRRHDRADLSVALGRHSRHAAAHGVLRLHRSGARRAGGIGDDVGARRRDPGGFGRAVPRRARAGTDRRRASEPGAYRFSVAVHPPRTLPAALNGFGLWLGLMVGLTIVNYGFPIAHLLATAGIRRFRPSSVGAR